MNNVGRPPKEPAARYRAICVSLPPGIIDALRKLATARRSNVSAVVGALLLAAPGPDWRALMANVALPLAATRAAAADLWPGEPDPRDRDDGVDHFEF